MALAHVIAYDISDDTRRAHLAAILQAHAGRVQRSVFVCSVEPDVLRELCDRVRSIINPRTGSVYVFRQCAPCWDAVGIYGQATVAGEPIYRGVL